MCADNDYGWSAFRCHYVASEGLMMEWLHAIVSGLLTGGGYWIMRSFGWFEDRSKGQRALIFMPVVFVIVLILNLIWPSA